MLSYTMSPAAGEAIAFFSAVVILGGRKPFVVDVACNIAEALAHTNEVPMCKPSL